MSENEVVFEPLPPARRGGRKPGAWVTHLAPCLERPGEWARVREFEIVDRARSQAGNLRRGYTQLPPGEWEFAARAVDGKGYLYARYLGTGNGAS